MLGFFHSSTVSADCDNRKERRGSSCRVQGSVRGSSGGQLLPTVWHAVAGTDKAQSGSV